MNNQEDFEFWREMDDIYARRADLQKARVWGGSYEVEDGACEDLAGNSGALLTKLLSRLKHRAQVKEDHPEEQEEKPDHGAFDDFLRINWEELWLVMGKYYPEQKRAHFECDDKGGKLSLVMSCDADMHLFVEEHPEARDIGHFGPPGVRVRTHQGGGRSSRVREALILLMLAIAEDGANLERDWTGLS